MNKEEKVIAFLGNDTDFNGKLKFLGTVRIDGRFTGEILATGTLIVGEGGVIEAANIHASSIVASGDIHGKISADERIDICAPGKVYGKINAPTVVIHEGGIFEGNCRMRPVKEADENNSTGNGSDEYTVDFSPSLGIIYGIVTGDTPESPVSSRDSVTAGKDEKKGAPIKDAILSAKCKGFADKNTMTNDSGYYELTDLEDGKWNLEVRAKGHKAVKATVEISGGSVHEQNFK